ncbi:hypothetical protein [Nostoc sp. CMAA1605]|uniref:hypothetical protein n=1 Tax=Nostoc sp. CMAA1605 TaxID=2055159 RepID=UPI001F448814|nr:hypothetical protein [Nostoc sp. CMAA1605]MCF4965605.1 hypothetical protein [Nostoc sp. CMAA1605]
MTVNSCASCAVVLNQQQEENIAHQHQCQDEPIQQNQNITQAKTVVENGKVVVKAAQPSGDETLNNA